MEDFIQQLKKSKPKDIRINSYESNLMRAIKMTNIPDKAENKLSFWKKTHYKLFSALAFTFVIIIGAATLLIQNKFPYVTTLNALQVMAKVSEVFTLNPNKDHYLESSYTVTTHYGSSSDQYTVSVNSLLNTDNGFINISQTNDITAKLIGSVTYALTPDYFNYSSEDGINIDLYNLESDALLHGYSANSTFYEYGSREYIEVGGSTYIQFYPQYDFSWYDPNATVSESTLYLHGFRKVSVDMANKILYGSLNPKIMDDQSKAEQLIYKLITSFTDFKIDRSRLLTDILNSPAFTFGGKVDYEGTSAYKITLNTNIRKVEMYIDANSFVILSLVEYDHSISDTQPITEMKISKYIVTDWKGFSSETTTTNNAYTSNQYDNNDYTMIHELQSKIDEANSLLKSDNTPYSAIFRDNNSTAEFVVDNSKQKIIMKGTQNGASINQRFENGKLTDLNTNKIISSSNYDSYLPSLSNAAQYVLSDLNGFSSYEGSLAGLGISSQRKITDSVGASEYTFTAKFTNGASGSILDLIFQHVRADWMTADGTYTYKFDSQGRVISEVIPGSELEFNYDNVKMADAESTISTILSTPAATTTSFCTFTTEQNKYSNSFTSDDKNIICNFFMTTYGQNKITLMAKEGAYFMASAEHVDVPCLLKDNDTSVSKVFCEGDVPSCSQVDGLGITNMIGYCTDIYTNQLRGTK